MRSVKSFLRAVPADLRREFLERYAAELAQAVEWSGSDEESLTATFDACGKAPMLSQGELQAEVERITSLANEAGEAAMRSVAADRRALEALPGNSARALWMFLHDFVGFCRAEEIRYTDERRRGRMWDGFEVPRNISLAIEPVVNRFKTLLRERLGSEKIHVEVFERTRIGANEREYRLLQVTIYREGWPDQVREFVGDNLQEVSRRPVYEAAITYEPTSGALEVVANEQKVREDLAVLFCSEILAAPFSNEKLKPRRYDLNPLRTPRLFAVDAEDRIDSVRVSMLRLMPLETAQVRVVIETLSRADETIWETAERLGSGNPLKGGWPITQARITVKFQPKPGNARGATLPITIPMPHKCDLKDCTPRERMVGDKYLVRWGLRQDVRPT